MNDNQSIKLNAAVAGQSFMDEPSNAGIWNTKAAVVAKKTELDNSITKTGQIDDDIEDDSGNVTSKSVSKDKGAKSTWRIAKALAAYYLDQNDLVNRAKVDFEWTDLRYAKDADAIDRWQEVQDHANPLAAALDAGGYGVTAAMVTQQLADLNDFKNWRPKPAAAKADKIALNLSLNAEFIKLDKIKVELLERLVQFEAGNLDFYNGAVNAFREINTGGRQQSIQIKYLDDATGLELPKVVVKVREDNLEKKSSKEGIVTFMLQECPQGNKTIDSTLPGYVPQVTSNVVSEAKKLTRLEIRLVKV